MKVAFITHSDCLLHDMGAGHPERPARLQAIESALTSSGLINHLQRYQATQATTEQLQRAHSKTYVDFIFSNAPQQGWSYIDPDTTMNRYTLNAALRAAGAVVQAVDLTIAKEVDAAFCNVRPPGHHAEHDRAMGFCFFNNIAVGVAHALAHHHLKRVAILDFDVHHGNGTEDIFREEERVLLCSSFQHPFYPYSGDDTHSKHIINSPLSAGAGGKEFKTIVKNHWLPALENFQPEMIFISAGFDAHHDDPLASLQFTEEDYAWITQQAQTIAKKYAKGRIVSSLEGGYELEALGKSAAAHVRVLLGM